jgi:hypothetical protein
MITAVEEIFECTNLLESAAMHWQITNASARGSTEQGAIEVFPNQPAQPARLHLTGDSPICWEAAAVRPIPSHATTPEEVYARENDLICRYQQSDQAAFSFQLDWQLLPPQGPFELGAELWLSVQTNLLNTQPMLEIVSRSLGKSAWQVWNHPQLSDNALADDAPHRGPAALVCQLQTAAGQTFSGLWLIEPTDQRHASLHVEQPLEAQDNGNEQTQATSSQVARICLFGHFMEKGVIRRGRMRFLLASSPIEHKDICSAYEQFSHSPLPLTA